MREVASRAGVSLATVSRVLNNTQHISEETRARVLMAVREFSYFKNVHARRLATGRSDLFGLVISEIANPYFPEIIRGYQAIAWSRGFDVLLCNTEYDRDRIKVVMRKLRESDVRGAAIVTSTVDRSMVSELTDTGIPVVLCNSDPAGRFVSNISIEYGPGWTWYSEGDTAYCGAGSPQRGGNCWTRRQPHSCDDQERVGHRTHSPRLEAGLRPGKQLPGGRRRVCGSGSAFWCAVSHRAVLWQRSDRHGRHERTGRIWSAGSGRRFGHRN